MRISDWSSDVCSSDLETTRHAAGLFNACTANIRLRIKRCITRRAVITGRGNANEGTLYVILGQAHRVIIATVRRTFWPNRNVTAWEFLLRSEEHTSELQSLMRISYAVLCLKKKKIRKPQT